MRLGNHRRGPAHVEIVGARTVRAGKAVVEPGLYRHVPMAVVGRVDGELMRLRRHADLGAAKDEMAALRVETENVGPGAKREREGGLRAVNRVAGRQLLSTCAQKTRRITSAAAGRSRKQRKDSADCRVGLNV